jgi:hypothetical protein
MKKLLCMMLLFAAGRALAAGGMTEVTYMDQEATSGGYVTRYLVTDRFLRMDYGRDREDFVVFDRREKRVYNVVHDRRQVLVFAPGPVTMEPPKEWKIKDDILDDRNAQKRVDLIVNGVVCSRLTASERFLPEVAQALMEFQETMAATHAATYLATPPEQRDTCDLARLVLEPRRWFKYGLALDELRNDGFSRRLLNYQADIAVRPKVFEVPADYRQISAKEMRGEAQ